MSWEVLFAGDLGAGFSVFSFFFCEVLTVALTLDAGLTVGSLTLFFLAGEALLVTLAVVTDFLVVALPRTVVAFLMTFLKLDLMDFGFSNLRFFPGAEVVSVVSDNFRLVPVVFAFLVFSSTTLRRWSLSLGRGPRIPRQLSAPQRHSWTFLLEYGLRAC